MRLTDQEKQLVCRYVQEGKPLPDKHRFLLFGEKDEVELVWNGKTGEVCNVVLPFQTIEQVDEPRAEGTQKLQGSLFDTSGRQISGWTNKLIWGDNKLILSSLKNGPMRREIEDAGGLKLIYIDPPFDVGADFSMQIEIGDEQLTKQPNVLEELAYRDTWGKGADSFIAMISERLSLMHDLLADDGSIYLHCDWRVNSYMRMVMDEIFGNENLRNQIVWLYSGGGISQTEMPKKHEDIFWYSKSAERWTYNPQYRPYSEGTLQRGRTAVKGQDAKLRDEGTPINDWWPDVKKITSPTDPEKLGYPTQKSEELLSRIVRLSSNEGDLVADFFCGSGTTLAVAEKLGRKWIGSDLGKFAIHTTRKRMIGVQRGLKKEGKNYRAFEILNLGKYERQHYVAVNPNLQDEEREQQRKQKEEEYERLILSAYKAQAADGFRTFHGKKSGRMVAIGPVDLPVSRKFIEEIIAECREKHITKADVLAFEFEMGLFPKMQEDAKEYGIDLALKYIPPDVFDKRAVEKNQVVFHDVAYIEVKPIVSVSPPARGGTRGGGSIAVELTGFSVFYNQDAVKEVEEKLKPGGKKLVVENGQIIKIEKDKDGLVTRETLTKQWTDWVDYWAVDFNFENKKEVVRVPRQAVIARPQPKQSRDGEAGIASSSPTPRNDTEYEDQWTGDYIFENEWQSFRTKKNRSLELVSAAKEIRPGPHKIAIKVVDIFGNDTMKVVEVRV